MREGFQRHGHCNAIDVFGAPVERDGAKASQLNGQDPQRIQLFESKGGAPYRARSGNPYAVIYRADIHLSILEAVKDHPLIQFRTNTQVCKLDQDANGATVIDQRGERYSADAVIGCDGLKSAIRKALVGDEHRVTGHVVYRAVVDVANMPTDLQINAPVVWAGPHCHLDAVPLGSAVAVAAADGDFEEAFKLYESARIPRTARVLYSAREMGRIYHAKGVERLVRNSLWVERTQEQFYDALAWLHGWRAEDCLAGAVQGVGTHRNALGLSSRPSQDNEACGDG